MQKRVAELDGLRGIAILQVLIWHYVVGPMDPRFSSVAHRYLGLTWSGVDLFFVLSGFLLGGILLDHRGSGNLFQVFYLRRCCRILPLYYAWILLFMVIVHFLKENAYAYPYVSVFDLDAYHTVRIPHYLGFIQNFTMAANKDWGNAWFGVTWSLSVEEQFYLVLPLIIYFCAARILPYVLLFFIVLAPVLRTILYLKLPLPDSLFWGFFLMPCRSDSLLLGALCAWALRQNGLKSFIQRQTKGLYGMAAVLLTGLCMLNLKGEGVCTPYMTWYGYTLLAVFYSCILLVAVTEKRGFLTAIVRNAWLGWLGIISYGVYIFHQAIQYLVSIWLFHNEPQLSRWPEIGASALAFVLTILAAGTSWVLFERPIVAWGHRWIYKK